MVRLFMLACMMMLVTAMPCYDGCRFTFCDGRTAFDMGIPNHPFTGALCNPMNKRVVQINDNTTCEAMVMNKNDATFTDISAWRPAELNVPFPSYFFKSMRNRFSSIMRAPWKGNQKQIIDGKCVIMPLDAWHMFDENGIIVSDEIYTRHNNMEDCVAFFVHTE